ncbi:MAG: KTSC domain-containing protein [Bacteroidaceae bacterium]|nr:KTSC domain-containing protein [Bacteroidaceae bacterium]
MIITQAPKMNILSMDQIPEIYAIFFSDSFEENQAIMASISSRDITKKMIRVKSSNLWSYCIDVRHAKDKTGIVYVQFKGERGGPGDVYCYYDVPVVVYQKLLAATSKGHAFWKYLRGKFLYSKLTGDKKTKMPGGVNDRRFIEPSVYDLAESSSVEDRVKAANMAKDQEIFYQLENDPSPEVRRAVASNCNNLDILEDLVFDESPEVRRVLMYVTNNFDILEVLSDDKEVSIRYELAKNCKNSKILEILTHDKNSKVRRCAERSISRLKK